MILHFSHIGLTDGRTFMIPFGWSGDPALAAGAAAATWSRIRPRTNHFACEQDMRWYQLRIEEGDSQPA
jgi:hypothetical protein